MYFSCTCVSVLISTSWQLRLRSCEVCVDSVLLRPLVRLDDNTYVQKDVYTIYIEIRVTLLVESGQNRLFRPFLAVLHILHPVLLTAGFFVFREGSDTHRQDRQAEDIQNPCLLNEKRILLASRIEKMNWPKCPERKTCLTHKSRKQRALRWPSDRCGCSKL